MSIDWHSVIGINEHIVTYLYIYMDMYVYVYNENLRDSPSWGLHLSMCPMNITVRHRCLSHSIRGGKAVVIRMI